MRLALSSLLVGLLVACGDDGETTNQGSGGGGGDSPAGSTVTASGGPTTATSVASTSVASTADATATGSGGTSGEGGVGGGGGSGGEGGVSPADELVIGVTGSPFAGAVLSSGDLALGGIHDGAGAFVGRMTTTGEMVWSLEGSPFDASLFRDVLVLEDDSIVVAGLAFEDGDASLLIARVSADGDVAWSASGPTSNSLRDNTGHLAILGDGLAVSIGFDRIVTLTRDGEPTGQLQLEDGAAFRLHSADGVEGAYVLGGQGLDEEPPIRSPWLGRIDDDGALVWQRRLDSTGRPSYGDATPDGGFVLAQSSSDGDGFFVVAMDPDGDVTWSRRVELAGIAAEVRHVAASTEGVVVLANILDEGQGLVAVSFTAAGETVAASAVGLDPNSQGDFPRIVGHGATLIGARPYFFGTTDGMGLVIGVEDVGDLVGCIPDAVPSDAEITIEDASIAATDDDVAIEPSEPDLQPLVLLGAGDVATSLLCADP